jgi:hypothetical protein
MRLLLLLPLLLVPFAARADPDRTPDAGKMHTDDCAKARKQNRTCVIDMGEGEKIGGNGLSPTGTAIGILKPHALPSLLPIRHEFIVEILKTAEDL